MNLTIKPKRKVDYRLEQVDQEYVLYNPADTKIISFNETAILIWQLCDGNMTVSEMIKQLQGVYPQQADEIFTDIQETLDQFLNLGCIEAA
jgi:uncharacterized protein YrzB (UPF0473 family)